MLKPSVPFALIGFAAVVAAFVIGLTSPALIEGDVTCGAAWGGKVDGATESGEADCAAIRSERFVWSIALLAVGLGAVATAAYPAITSPIRPRANDDDEDYADD